MEKLFQSLSRWINGPTIAIFHKFQKPPYGGGNQFLLALTKELVRQGYDVRANTAGKNTQVILFNSFEIDKDKLERLYRKYRPRMVQRLAGPIGVYRGTDIEIDRKIFEWNREFADSTIFISRYSHDKYVEIGLLHKDPHIITNACDPAIFHQEGRISAPDSKRKVKLIATAWSNNPKKGGPTLAWLDEHLDHSKYELTFVGRTKASFREAKLIDPLPSEELAKILREHDIYIAPSEDDPCSNALIEALACGLPAAYRISGGHPELVQEGGEGWSDTQTLLIAIDKIANNLESYQKKIPSHSIQDVAKQYLNVLNLNEPQ
jgi:glycosyltransferase involved in cell wall biosynthesis